MVEDLSRYILPDEDITKAVNGLELYFQFVNQKSMEKFFDSHKEDIINLKYIT